MNLHQKTRAAVGALAVLFLLAAWGAAQFIMIAGLERLEKHETSLDLHNVWRR
jgi:hypothetical protein